MREKCFIVGRERFGHIILDDYAITGDCLTSVLQVFTALSALGGSSAAGSSLGCLVHARPPQPSQSNRPPTIAGDLPTSFF